MPQIHVCRHCKQNYSGDICRCIIKFGRGVETDIKAWRRINGRKAFSADIQRLLDDERWEAYIESKHRDTKIARQNKAARRQASSLAKKAEDKINVAMTKMFGSEFFVRLDATCIRRTTYA